MPIDSKECFAALTEDGQLWEIYQAAQTGGGASGPAGGDLTGTYPNPTVDGLQGTPVSSATPYNGQVLQFDGTSWVPGSIPSGGSGGGGVVYFLNFNTAADAPVTNIPQTPNASKELAIAADTVATSYTSANLPTASYAFLGSFVTDLNVPSATSIPAGLWDFNIYAQSSTTNVANQVYFKIEVLKYDGVNAPTLISTSNDTYIYDPTEVTQYVSSCIIPSGVTLTATDRLVVYLYGRAHQANKDITFHFGSTYPSHTHSTMPSVTGTGVVKVVNGVFQSPASTIVNADVSASAAIDVSKLAMSTNRLLGRTTAGTGAVEQITVGTGLSLSAGTLSSTVTAGVTSVTGTSPIASSGGTTPAISIADAAADGTTKGAAAFNASDFNSASGVISLDYTNGQSASASNKGFLTSADWTTFNNKTGGSVGAVDNAVLRADVGTGIVQNSGLIVEDAIESFTSITGDAGTDVITATGSAFANGQPVRFTALTGGSGLNTTTNYFVREVSGATFKLETSIGGGAINFTTNITAGTLLTGHSVSTNVTLSENTTATNSDLVLTPKGTGALIAGPKPDGTATGGNARGSRSVDLQMSRTNAGHVTVGSGSALIGCQNSRANGQNAAVLGGSNHETDANNVVIIGGSGSIVNGTNSISIGGVGQSITGGNSCGINFGGQNNISGGYCFSVGGDNQIVSNGVINIGADTRGDRTNSIYFGTAGRFSAIGDNQVTRFVLKGTTTTNSPVELFNTASNRFSVPLGKVIALVINICGIRNGGADVAHYIRQYALKNFSATTTEVYAPVTIGTDNAAGTAIALSANDTNDALRVEVTGVTGQTWRWVASIEAVEITAG